MGVKVIFHCNGCQATAPGTDTLRREFRSVSGRDWGIGGVISINSVEDVTPQGWWAYDPYTFATYCPKCRQSIESPSAQEQTDE